MILIVVEHANGKVSKSTWEMVTAARDLAQDMGREAPITALVLGSNIASIAAEIARAVDQVLVADLPALAQYDPELSEPEWALGYRWDMVLRGRAATPLDPA